MPTTPGTVLPGATAPGGDGPRRVGKPRRSLPVLLGCLAGSWLLPLGLTALHLGVLLLPILVLAVAGLIRVGGVLLDRLVAAGLILAGAVLVLGLGFSLWPWGLAPYPVSGVLLTVVSLAGWFGRRAPRLPLRFRGSDLLVLGTGYAVWHYLYHPLVGRSAVERISFFATSEDRLSHFSFFSAIQHVGGYGFLHQEAARSYLIPPSEVTYPQGSHFLLAWIDALVHSSADPGAGIGTMNRYLIYIMVAYALLCAALVWAARWIGGPRLRGWRSTAVCATVMALVLSSNYLDLLPHGFDSEIIGLLFLTVTLALLVRPAMGRAEFLLVAVAGLVTVTYSYNIFGAIAGLALGGTVLVNRRRFAGRWLLVGGALIVGLGLAGLPSALSVLANLDVAGTSNMNGPSVPVDATVLIGGGLLALLAAVRPENRRTAVGRSHLVLVLGSGLVIGLFGVWQVATIHKYSYYFHKMAAAGIVVSLISLGAVGTLLRLPVSRPGAVTGIRRRAGDVLVSGLTVMTALSLFAGYQWGFLSTHANPAAWYSNPLVKWSKGDYWSDMGPKGVQALLPSGGNSGPVVVLYSDDAYKNLKATWLAQLLRPRGGDMASLYDIHWVGIGAAPVKESDYQEAMGRLTAALGKLHGQPTVLTADKAVGERIRRDLHARGIQATVLSDPDNEWTESYWRTFPGG